MSKRWRYLWRGVAGLGLLGLLLALAGAWWGPGYVEGRVRAALDEAGLGPSAWRVERVRWGEVAIRDVVVGEGAPLRIERVDATFDLSSLLAGRARRVRVSGLEWGAAWRDGAFRYPPFEGLHADEGDGALVLPFDDLEVVESRLVIDVEGARVDAPFRASVVRAFGGDRATATVVVQRGPDVRPILGASATVRLADGTVERANLRVDGLVLDDQPQLTAAIEAVVGLEVTGRIDFDCEWRPGQPLGRPATLRFSGGSVRLPDSDHAVAGLSVAVDVTSVEPLASGPSRVRFTEATFGDIVLTDGEIGFVARGPREVRVDSARLRLGRGSVSVSPFTIDPLAPDIKSRATLEDVALERWLSLLTMGHVEGSGRVRGEVAFRLRLFPELRFALGEGTIEAVGGGELGVTDLATAEQWVDDGVARLEDLDMSGLVRQRIIEALQRFRYDTLRFELRRATDDLAMRLTTSGRGVTGARQPIGSLTVNVQGINGLVDASLRSKIGYDRLVAAMDRLKANLEAAAGETP